MNNDDHLGQGPSAAERPSDRTPIMDLLMLIVRHVLMSGGGALAAHGIGDAALWETVIGGVLAIGGSVWSYYARRKALATVPPEIAAALKIAYVLKSARNAATSVSNLVRTPI